VDDGTGVAAGSDEEDLLRRMGVRASVMLPVRVQGRVSGLLAFQTRTGAWRAVREVVARAAIIGDVLAHALSRREITLRLHDSERRFAQIFASAMDAAVLLDERGVVRDWNPAASTVFGRARESMLEADLARAVRVEDHPTLAREVARFVADAAAPAARFELVAVWPDGRLVPIELSMTRLDAADAVVLVAFVRDITDRKRAEADKQRAFDEVARQKRNAERERDYLREERGDADPLVVGESAAIRRVVDLVAAVADTNASVLLTGESGVGKEVFARMLHRQSARRDGPWSRSTARRSRRRSSRASSSAT
jgi:PAS domain S-box-containing protein